MTKTILLALLLFACTVVEGQTYGYHSARFSYSGSDAKIIQALTDAEAILQRPDFWQAVRAYPQQNIDNSTYTMSQLADTLQFRPCLAQVAYLGGIHRSTAVTGRPNNQVQISLYKHGYKQAPQDLACTFLHEWVHAVDYALHVDLTKGRGTDNLKFAHFDSPMQGRCPSKDTASYRIERIIDTLLGNPDYALRCRSAS